jgi:undecaprenyl-diphosphatase
VRLLAARLVLGLLVFVLVGWAVGALWISMVGTGETEAVRELVQQRSAGLTAAARAVTWAGSALVLVPLVLACCALLIRAHLRAAALAVAVGLGGAMLLSNAVKLLVSRPRPPVEHLQAVSSSSFPSGHATQASAFWVSLALVLRAERFAPRPIEAAIVFAVLLVGAVAASRVYLGVHYPADVLVGVLLGSGWALFASRCIREAGVR